MKNARANSEKNAFFFLRSFGLLKQLYFVCYFCVHVNILFFVCIVHTFETIQYISSKASTFVRMNKRKISFQMSEKRGREKQVKNRNRLMCKYLFAEQ